MIALLTALLIWSLVTVGATPSPAEIGSDVLIATHNDLYPSSQRESVLVLTQSMSYQAATRACEALGESLWGPSSIEDCQELGLESQNCSFWTSTHSCLPLSDGDISVASRNEQKHDRPVLCTNSAPISTSSQQDNSTQWRVSVNLSSNHSLTGFRDKYAFRFTGIRYAAQPERFTYSTLYTDQVNATALGYGPQCAQAPDVGSEDCLFLNVWTPSLPHTPSHAEGKAVMFWIHGGAFTGGTGSDPTYDGAALASRGDVVVVSINYRLSTLGFLALPDGDTNGNYGLGDQVTALDWVHKYIHHFGGDASRVTIFGQSAGAASVRALMASPKAFGKFAAAIPQSNLAGLAYATTYSQYYDIPTEYSVAAQSIVNLTGCTNASSQVDCLRGIDPFVLLNLPTVARFLVQDGEYLVSDGLALTGDEPVADVHLLMGFMRDDGAPFIPYPTATQNVSTLLGPQGFAETVTSANLSLYPVPNGVNLTNNIYNASSALATDAEFRCLDEATAYSAQIHHTFKSVWMYEFNRSYNGYDPHPPVCEAPIQPGFPQGNPSGEYFKCHSGELNYVFGTLTYLGLPDRDGLDIPMSQFILDSWASFARTYDPTPDLHFLNSRGYRNTSMEIERSSPWVQVDPQSPTLRVLQYPSYQSNFSTFSSATRCQALGLPLDFFERP